MNERASCPLSVDESGGWTKVRSIRRRLDHVIQGPSGRPSDVWQTGRARVEPTIEGDSNTEIRVPCMIMRSKIDLSFS